jgi:hypothetical protein
MTMAIWRKPPHHLRSSVASMLQDSLVVSFVVGIPIRWWCMGQLTKRRENVPPPHPYCHVMMGGCATGPLAPFARNQRQQPEGLSYLTRSRREMVFPSDNGLRPYPPPASSVGVIATRRRRIFLMCGSRRRNAGG